MLIQETGLREENANSYATLAFANTYFTHHAKAATWAALNDDEKATALVTGARLLDVSFVWKGTQVSASQAMEWPRYGVTIAVGGGNEELSTTTIPSAILRAQCEVAILCAEGDRMADAASAGVSKVGVGDGAIEVTFDAKTRAAPCGETAPLMVRAYIAGGAAKNNVAEVVRS